MCILRFLGNLIKPKNWPLLLFILLNIAMAFILFGGYKIFKGTFDKDALILTAFLSGCYIIALFIAITPIGEFFLRLTYKCRVLTRCEETKRIYDIFDQVYQEAKTKNKRLSKKVKLCMIMNDEPNAFALGSRTLIINSGLLQLGDEELKGIISHEFGHLSSYDSMNTIALLMSNLIVLFVVTIIKIAIIIGIGLIELALYACFGNKERNCNFTFTKLTCNLISFLYEAWIMLGSLLMLKTSRNAEYKADQYARELGHGEGLANALLQITPNITIKSTALEMITHTHPDSMMRINRLGFTVDDINKTDETTESEKDTINE